jgi:rod shape determining protein RodA
VYDEERTNFLPASGWLLLLAALTLSAIGLLGIYTGEMNSSVGPAFTLRQVAYVAAGLIAFVLTYVAGYQRFGRWSYVFIAVALVLLALLIAGRWLPLAPFIQPKRNAYRWIDVGPVGFQVSEFAKFSFVLAMAWYLRFRSDQRTLLGWIRPGLLTALTAGLILVEPDLGTALLFAPALLVMMFAAGARLWHVGLFMLIGWVAAPAFYFSPLMSDYQRARVQAVLRQNNPDPRWQMGPGYQLRQSKIALGSGGAYGQGMQQGAFFRHNLLPEEHNDFIFAVIGHQWGFFGCAAVVFAYLLIITTLLTLASITHDPFGRLVAVGLAAMLGAQVFINIGMTIGLLPVTGLSLPFVSFGGSGLVANFAAMGLAAGIGRTKTVSIAPRAFEFVEDEVEAA